MKRFMSLSMAALLATTMVVLSFSQADARHRRHRGVGAGVAAGVIGGLIVGGAIANAERRRYREPRRYRAPPRRYRGDAHERWCYSRYRSYRAYDNTYQPYRGGRRYCRSPYG